MVEQELLKSSNSNEVTRKIARASRLLITGVTFGDQMVYSDNNHVMLTSGDDHIEVTVLDHKTGELKDKFTIPHTTLDVVT